jgi:hypothetical protein
MTRSILTLAVAFLAGACAAHRSSSPQSAPLAAQTAADGKKAKPLVLCRTERPTGSNIMTRVCYTEEEVDTMDPAAQDLLRRQIQQGSYQRERN